LDSTIRWKQVNLVKFYLDEIQWPYEYLLNATKLIQEYLSQNIDVVNKIKALIKLHKKKSSGCCCVFGKP